MCRVPGRRGATSTRTGCASAAARAGGFTTLAALTFHDVFAAGASHYGVADLGALAARHPQVREPATSTASSGRGPRRGRRYEERSPIFHTDGIDRPLAVFQGLDDAIVPPNQAEMIVDGAARPRACPVAYLAVRGRAARLPPGARTSAPRSTASCSFYAQVLGFDLPADEGIDPIEVENL